MEAKNPTSTGLGDSSSDTKALEREEARFRQYPEPAASFIRAISAGCCLFFILYVAGIFAQFRVFFLANEFNAIFLAVVLTLTFLLIPAGKGAPKNRLPWYDLALILTSLAGCTYIIANSLELASLGKISATPLEIALGTITILALVEAVRRSFGWAMVIIVVAFILYTKFGYLIPGPLNVYYFSWSMLASDIYLSFEGIFGSLTSIASGIVITFITFGVFFTAAGGGDFFLNLALALTGSMRGGPAKAAIVGSALFGTLSGSPTANVVVTGSVTIPLMKSAGYKPYYAGAIETIASTGGALAPPVMAGIAFVMASLVGKPYAYIATIAALPALLYFISLYTQVHLHACKTAIRPIPPEQLPSLKATLKGGWEFFLPFMLLILLLFFLKYPAETAAIYTILSLIALSMFRREHRLNLKRLIDCLDSGLRNTLPVASILALAGIILAALSVSGLGPKLSAALVTFSGGNMLWLVALAGIACYVLGMGISWIASYILVATLVAPALLKLGLPVIVSHFFIMYLVLSGAFTPPYCMVAYVASTIAKAHPFRIGFQAMRLGIVTFLIPFVIIYNPALILIGEPGEIVLAALTAIIGIIGLSVGIEGYLFSGTNWVQRVLFIIGGLAMFIPGLVTDIIGLVTLAMGAFWQWRGLRGTAVPVAEEL